MLLKIKKIVFLIFAVGFITSTQAQHADIDTIRVSGIVLSPGDTIPVIPLSEYTHTDSLSNDKNRKYYWRRLRYNVYKVYPYAIKASYIVNDIYQDLDTIENRRARKRYLKSRERELKSKFKNDLKDLTTVQGEILVKLINRQTGKNVFVLIKELKSGFHARISQTTAFFFKNNLKATYDPFGEDKDIELIIQEIEKKGFYKNLHDQADN